MNEFLAKNSTNIIEKPPYSTDMAPADIFLFLKLKIPLRGTRFQSIEDIKENSRRELNSIPENAFKKCFNSKFQEFGTVQILKIQKTRPNLD